MAYSGTRSVGWGRWNAAFFRRWDFVWTGVRELGIALQSILEGGTGGGHLICSINGPDWGGMVIVWVVYVLIKHRHRYIWGGEGYVGLHALACFII